ncbi:MAG TPA: hypothetical protein DCQ36_06955 [Actinobacteria bacterium]|nr:hypothetical protein [Actinomycetota bacterium]
MPTGEPRRELSPGEELCVTTTVIAHGGHVIAHAEGRTLLVRHALPGETVRVKVTDVSRRVVRADAVEVLEPAEGRVEPPCRWSGPGGCGGCDFQHVELSLQRRLKSEVLTDALMRFGGISAEEAAGLSPEVKELEGFPEGLRWMRRVRWARDKDGAVGLRRHRSHDVIEVDHCLLAREDIDHPGAVRAGHDHHVVRDREWRVGGFWQVHATLPEALVAAVLDLGRPQPGERWWDLFAGAGLFAAFLAEAVGTHGSVVAVESSGDSVRSGRRSLGDLPQVRFQEAAVAEWIVADDHEAPDGMVIDPPRSGAGEALMAELTQAGIPRMVYVACDPVALGRDVRVARSHGYALTAIRAFDAFPMTHHFETVALLERDAVQPLMT